MKRNFYQGRFALVVGGSQGIGRAIAELLDSMSCRVCVIARDESRLKASCSEMSQAFYRVLDVSQAEPTRQALSLLIAEHGVPDFVFNCAGLALPGYLEERSLEGAKIMMDLNYFGTLHVCQSMLEPMKERGGGTIVNVSSLGGIMGLFGYTTYCATKFAVIGFSEALRREVHSYGIKVCVLCPPNTDTPGLQKENLLKPPEVLAQEEKVRTVKPEYVARKLLEALPKGKKMVIPTFDGWMAYYLSRYAPFVLDRILKRPIL